MEELMHESFPTNWMAPGASSTVGSILFFFFLTVFSGLVLVVPFVVHGQSTMAIVSIPKGSGSGQSAAPGYSPASVTVVIGVNNTVVWTNNDTTIHTVTPSNSPSGASWSGSGDIATSGPTSTYSFKFTVPGTYTYHCNYHSWMAGTVVVRAAASTSTSITTSTTPEFPLSSLAVILFAIMVTVMLAAPRLRPSRTIPQS